MFDTTRSHADPKTDDEFTLLLTLSGYIGAIVAVAGAIVAFVWSEAVAWLVAHQVLVPAGAQPWVDVPHADGAGLDGPRTAIAAAIVLLVVAAVASGIRRMWVRSRLVHQ